MNLLDIEGTYVQFFSGLLERFTSLWMWWLTETVTDRVIFLETQQGPLWSSFPPTSTLDINTLQSLDLKSFPSCYMFEYLSISAQEKVSEYSRILASTAKWSLYCQGKEFH